MSARIHHRARNFNCVLASACAPRFSRAYVSRFFSAVNISVMLFGQSATLSLPPFSGYELQLVAICAMRGEMLRARTRREFTIMRRTTAEFAPLLISPICRATNFPRPSPFSFLIIPLLFLIYIYTVFPRRCAPPFRKIRTCKKKLPVNFHTYFIKSSLNARERI